MSNEYKINEELVAVEAVLTELQPIASSIDRDRMIFQAGKASVAVSNPPPTCPRTNWLWPATTAVSLLLAIGFGGMFFMLGSPRVEKQIVYVEVDRTRSETNFPKKLWYDVKSEPPKAERPVPTPGERMDYLSLSSLVATHGAETLPLPKTNPISPNELPRNRPATYYRYWEMILNDY